MEWYNGKNSVYSHSKHFNTILITIHVIRKTKNKRIRNKNFKRNTKEWEMYNKECEQIEERISNGEN